MVEAYSCYNWWTICCTQITLSCRQVPVPVLISKWSQINNSIMKPLPLCVTSSCDHSTLHALFSSSPSMLGSLIYNLKVNDLIFSIKHNCHLYLLLEQAQLQLTQTHYQSLFISINRSAKARFGQVGDQISQAGNQVGQGPPGPGAWQYLSLIWSKKWQGQSQLPFISAARASSIATDPNSLLEPIY